MSCADRGPRGKNGDGCGLGFILATMVRRAPGAQGTAGAMEPARPASSNAPAGAVDARDVSPGVYSSSHTRSMDQKEPNGATSTFFTLLLNTEKMAGSWTNTMGAASTIFAWNSS